MPLSVARQVPHIVAHSLGSFILGRTLFRFPEFNAGKIVLLGCVLTPKFKWDILRKQFD
jgi:pimeloyl-ACP methyl ester carboxylesterase